MSSPLVLGVDVGTTYVKVACFDDEGHRKSMAQYSYETICPRPGWAEQDPREWIRVIERGLRTVVADLGLEAKAIAGLALCACGPGIVMINKVGSPLAPCPTWQDSRCRPYGQKLLDAVGNGWIGLGDPLSGLPARLLWALETMEETVRQVDTVADVKGYLLRWLVGQAITDASSGPALEGWWRPVFDYIGWPLGKLPRIAAATEMVGVVKEDVAHRVGLRSGLPVFAGMNDGASAMVGSSAVRTGDLVISLATNGVARLVIPSRLSPDVMLSKGLFCWPFVGELWACGGMTLNGAASLRWFADILRVPHDPDALDDLLAEAGRVPAGSRGVLFLPYLRGRGAPFPDEGAKGGYIGLRQEYGRAEMVRALLEGVSYALREVGAELESIGHGIRKIHVTGGGARSPLWRQILADVLDRPAEYTAGDSTLGSAIVAAVGLGMHSDFEKACGRMVTVLSCEEPIQENVAEYARMRRIFIETTNAVLSVS